MGLIWLAAKLVVTTLLTGPLFVPGVSFAAACVMIVIGTIVGAVVLVLVGNIGTRTGLPTMAVARGAFGVRGGLLPMAANIIILMGWSWVQAMLAGVTINALIEQATGLSNPVLFSVLCEALAVALAIFGHEGIARIEPWLAVLILAVIGAVFIAAFQAYDLGDFLIVPTDPSIGLTAFSALDIVIATAISWTVLSADMNRYARSSAAGITGSGIGCSLSAIIAMALGLVSFTVLLLDGQQAEAFDPAALLTRFGWPLGTQSCCRFSRRTPWSSTEWPHP